MNSARIIIIICFAAAFGAGLFAGKLWERTAKVDAPVPPDGTSVVVVPVPEPAPPPTTTQIVTQSPVPQPPEQAGWLRELNLTAEQNKQMGQIWADAMKNRPKFGHEKTFAARKERDDAIKAVLTEEQRSKQRELYSTTDAKNIELEKKMREDQANLRRQRDEALTAMLNDEQKKAVEAAKKTYEEKMKEAMRDNEWKRTFDDAVAKTREILSPEQVKKYDEIRKQHQGPPNRFGPRPDGNRPDRGGPRPGGGDSRGERNPGDKPPGEPRGDAHDGQKPVVKPKSGFVLEKVGGSRARVSRPPHVTFQA